jgi:Type IV pili methyl-accepting chemotaxis transducer N-term
VIQIQRRQLILGALGAAGLSALPGRAQSQSVLGAMINTSGRNRMHSQRLARSYAQLVLNIDAEGAQRHLKESMTAVGGTIEALDLAAINPAVRASVKVAATSWQKYKAQLDAAPSKTQLPEVNAAAEDFFIASNALTTVLQDAANQKSAKLTNDAGAQRPRAMRLAKCYLLQINGVNVANEIRSAKAQFESIHAALEQAPETTGNIRAQLDLVKIQFGFISTAVDGANLDREKFGRAAVSTSERIVDMMDDVVRGYAQQVRA